MQPEKTCQVIEGIERDSDAVLDADKCRNVWDRIWVKNVEHNAEVGWLQNLKHDLGELEQGEVEMSALMIEKQFKKRARAQWFVGLLLKDVYTFTCVKEINNCELNCVCFD